MPKNIEAKKNLSYSYKKKCVLNMANENINFPRISCFTRKNT